MQTSLRRCHAIIDLQVFMTSRLGLKQMKPQDPCPMLSLGDKWISPRVQRADSLGT